VSVAKLVTKYRFRRNPCGISVKGNTLSSGTGFLIESGCKSFDGNMAILPWQPGRPYFRKDMASSWINLLVVFGVQLN